MTRSTMPERRGHSGWMWIGERDDRKVPLRKNFDTHLRRGFHGATRGFVARMRTSSESSPHIVQDAGISISGRSPFRSPDVTLIPE